MKLLVALGIAGLLVGAGLIAAWDEPLSPQAAAWLEEPYRSLKAERNAYFSMMGFFAAPSDDPFEVGRQRVKAYELALAEQADGSTLAFDDYPAHRRMAVATDLGSLCQAERTSCLHKMAAQSDTIGSIRERHRVLLDRYLRLHQLQRFATTATPSVNEPRIPYGIIMGIHRLNLALLGRDFMAGQPLKATRALLDDIRFWRLVLGHADQMDLKVAALRMLASGLHLFSEFLDSKDFPHAHLTEFEDGLRPMEVREYSAEVAIHREFRSTARYLLTFSGSDGVFDSRVPDWIMRPLYKPRATVNRILPRFRRSAFLAALDGPEFAREWAVPASGRSNFLASMLNPIGSVMADVITPGFAPHLAALHDGVGLVRLVELKVMIRTNKVQPESIPGFLSERRASQRDPYRGSPMTWDPRRQVISFEGLSEDDYLQELPVPFL